MYRNLKRYAEIKNIKGKIIYFKSPTKMVESFVKGELAGIAIWEPYLTNLKNSGYRVDYFRDLIGDHFCCSIAINDETSRINRDALKKLISEYDDLCINGWISDEDITKVAEILEFDEDVVKKSLKNYIFCPELNLEEIISYLKDSGIDLSYESVLSVFEI
jgi:predicted transcriptional regulator